MNISELAAAAILADTAIKAISNKHAETRGAWPASDQEESDFQADAWVGYLDELADLPSQTPADCEAKATALLTCSGGPSVHPDLALSLASDVVRLAV